MKKALTPEEKLLSSIIVSTQAFRQLEQACDRMAAKQALPLAQGFERIIQSLRPPLCLSVQNLTIPILRDIQKSNVLITESLARSSELEKFARGFTSAHAEWQARLTPIHRQTTEALRSLDRVLLPHMASLTRLSHALEQSISRLPWNTLADRIGVTAAQSSFLQRDFLELSDSYSKVFEGLEREPAKLAALPPAASINPPIEVSNHTDFLLSVSTLSDETQETTPSARKEISRQVAGTLDDQLGQLDAGFLDTLNGARESLRSHNPDKVRHTLTSLRELVSHVMHTIAPDEGVKKWTADPQHIQKGRPTRRARILYICRSVYHPPLPDFLEADIKAALGVFDLFQKGTHELQGSFSDEQLSAVLARVEGILYFWLAISGNPDSIYRQKGD